MLPHFHSCSSLSRKHICDLFKRQKPNRYFTMLNHSHMSAISTELVASPKQKRPKHKFAMVFGYTGTKYQGLQKNPGAITIEDILEKTLHDLDFISDDNFGTLQKISWTRAARTDKGVHALGQVVAANLMLEKDACDSARESINKALPDDIVIFDMFPVTNGFDSKCKCTGRQYTYVLPTFLLRESARRVDLSEKLSSVTSTEVIRAESSDSAALSEGYDGTSCEPFDISEMADPSSSSAAAEAEAPAEPAEGTKGSETDISVPYIKGAVKMMKCAHKYIPTDEEMKENHAYRVTVPILTKFNDALQMYVGTRNFHNFSPRTKAWDDSSNRFIVSIVLGNPVILNGVEFVVVTIEGQSFMLNQIRNMIGLAIEVTRGTVPQEIMSIALSKDKLIQVPMAPGEGLVLNKCLYRDYVKQFGESVAKLKLLEPQVKDRIKTFFESHSHLVPSKASLKRKLDKPVRPDKRSKFGRHDDVSMSAVRSEKDDVEPVVEEVAEMESKE